MSDWDSEGLSEWMSYWDSEGLSEWMSDWDSEGLSVPLFNGVGCTLGSFIMNILLRFHRTETETETETESESLSVWAVLCASLDTTISCGDSLYKSYWTDTHLLDPFYWRKCFLLGIYSNPTLKGTARYAGLLLAPAESFSLRPRLFLPFGQKKGLLCCFGPFLAFFGFQHSPLFCGNQELGS